MKRFIILFPLFLSLACSAPLALTVAATPVLTMVSRSAVTQIPAFAPAVRFDGPTAITAQTEDPAGVVYMVSPVGSDMVSPVWMLALGDVNIRAAPSAEAAILSTLLEGQGIEVFVIVDGWAQVKNGYVKAEWLK